MSNFDSKPLLGYLDSFWSHYYRDTPKLERFWDALARTFDDEWAQASQINDSGNVSSVPVHIYHTYLYRLLDNWKSYGLPHTHFKKEFRASAGQTIFYIGAWPQPGSTTVFVNGKEIDVQTDPYTITFDQDGTQPGANPAGARLIFRSPIGLNYAVAVFSDKLLHRVAIEVPPTGLPSISFPYPVDEFTSKVVLEKINITRFLTIETDKFYWTSSNPVSDSRRFRRGEVFEVVDGSVVQSISVAADASEVDIPLPVTPGTTSVYKVLDFDITHGKVSMDNGVLRASGQIFPVSSRIRARDGFGAVGVTVSGIVDSLEFGRVFDNPTVFMYGGEILGGYETSDDTIVFNRSFDEGMVISIEAPIVEDNDHAHHRYVTTQLTNEISVPNTRPWILTAGLAERPEFPIQFFVNGVLLHSDLYTFKPGATTYTIVLVHPLIIPAGTPIDVYYVDKEDPKPHKHVRQRFEVTVPTSAFSLSDFVEDQFAPYVNVSGYESGDPSLRRFTPDGKFLNFSMPITTGTIIKVRGARTSYGFYHDIDPEVVRAEFLQNGIDQRSSRIPAGWTVQLVWDDGFVIEDGLLESDIAIENAWFKDVLIDEETGYTNFGKLIEFYRENSEEYIKILSAVFAGNYMGSQPQTIENFVNIILGSDYLAAPSEVTSISDGVVSTNDEKTYLLDPEVSPRVSAREAYERFYAVSNFASIVENWTGLDLVAIMAEQFSPNYRYGKNLDIHRPVTHDGGYAEYDRDNGVLVDPASDFYEWEVWPGDLIAVYPQWSPSVPRYGRVTKVDRHSLGIALSLGIGSIAYGEGDYGEYTYGGTSTLEQVDHYRLWTRETDRIDSWRFLDEALSEEIPYLQERFSDLFSKHIFLVKIMWAARRSGQALDDVKRFLDRSKPHDKAYIGYSEVYDDAGLSDEVAGDLTDEDPDREVIPGVLFTSQPYGGYAGINGQVSPNVGGFAGVRVIP